MQDVFIEHMVKRRRTPKHTLLTILIIVAVVILVFLAMMFMPLMGQFSMFGMLAIFGAIWGAYTLLRNMNVEYEYLVTNGEMDIDQITAQSKRKRLITVNARNVDEFGRYKPEAQTDKTYAHKILAYDNIQSDDLWYLVTNNKDKGKTLVIFNGAERVLGALKPFLPRQIMQEAFINIQR